MDKGALPTVSVFVLNCNDRAYLPACFSSLAGLDYPPDQHKIVLVDNHSTDGSIEYVRKHFPQVQIVAHARNEGFSRGNNLAAQQSDARYVAFLNADTRVDPAWLRELVVAITADEETVCASAKILSKDGKTIDFVGSRLNFYGHGLNIDYGRDHRPGAHDRQRTIPFACGGAMLINREVFLSVEGFDEEYFAYFEDVDLGWRLGLMGYQIVYAPRAVTYHHHHGHWGKRPAIHRFTLLERNALYTIIKNYQDENLDRVLTLALFLAVKRSVVDSRLNPAEFHYTFEGVSAQRSRTQVPKMAFCPLMAVDQVIENLPRLLEKRRRIQATRRRSDAEFFTRFAEGMLSPNRTEPAFVTAQSALLRSWALPDFFQRSSCRNLLIITHDTVGPKMAGPAIRYWELAQALCRHVHVTLAAPGDSRRPSEGFEVRGYTRMDDGSIAPLLSQADVILTCAYTLNELPILGTVEVPLILDLYNPYVLENLEAFRTFPERERREKHDAFLAAMNHQLGVGDFFICASERQRCFWLGMLAANHRVNPSTYEQDKSLRKLIDVVPFGLSSRPPQHHKRVLKGVWPGIDKEDKVILWGGGIWEWLDPLTCIRAMAEIATVRRDVKLFFMGKGHHDPSVAPDTEMAERAVRLAKELGLLDRFVFFADWVPYDERENYLLEADLGTSLHFDHVETRHSFRTRLLDYIWAGLPVVVTRGDYMGGLLLREELGQGVPAEDVRAVSEAIIELLAIPDLKQRLAPRFARLAARFRWQDVAQPIVQFCQQPWMAPDRVWVDVNVSRSPIQPPPWWTLPGKAWHYVRRGGPMALWRATGAYLRWLRIIRRRQSGEGL